MFMCISLSLRVKFNLHVSFKKNVMIYKTVSSKRVFAQCLCSCDISIAVRNTNSRMDAPLDHEKARDLISLTFT